MPPFYLPGEQIVCIFETASQAIFNWQALMNASGYEAEALERFVNLTLDIQTAKPLSGCFVGISLQTSGHQNSSALIENLLVTLRSLSKAGDAPISIQTHLSCLLPAIWSKTWNIER